MTGSDIMRHRLRHQLLSGSSHTSAATVVQWMGCLQAADYAAARRSIAARLQSPRHNDTDRLINEGQLQRSFLLKPLPCLVTAADNARILPFTAPGVQQAGRRLHRMLGIDAALLKRSRHLLEKTLRDGQQLTRAQLAPILGLRSQDLRMPFLLMDAELEGVIRNGPLQGKTFTYQLQPHLPAVHDASAALWLLADRYFRSRGPARLQDFVGWSGLSAQQARQGIAMAELAYQVVDGEAYWYAADMDITVPDVRSMKALPMEDEFWSGYESEITFELP